MCNFKQLFISIFYLKNLHIALYYILKIAERTLNIIPELFTHLKTDRAYLQSVFKCIASGITIFFCGLLIKFKIYILYYLN